MAFEGLLLCSFMESGLVEQTFSTFQHMPEKDALSWATCIHECARRGHFKQAIGLFRHRRKYPVLCHGAIIQALGANGEFNKVEEVFREVSNRDLTLITSMMLGLVQWRRLSLWYMKLRSARRNLVGVGLRVFQARKVLT